MAVIPNKWTQKERKKKSYESTRVPNSEIQNDENIAPPHLTVSRATRSRTLRGVRK